MSSIPKYVQGDFGRFDFRISDGLGSYLEPDWDDPYLKVEFYDGQGVLRFTSTKTSNPGLGVSEDASGKFIFVQGIGLSEFAPGICDAHIYCKVNGSEVLPYPTIIPAFQVISGTGAEPVYTTVEKVKSELPDDIPDQLTDLVIEQYIYDASRRIDAFLYGFYAVPFPGIEESPRTPALIERICRKLAVSDALIFLGTFNQMELNPASEQRMIEELERLRKGDLQIPGYDGPLSVYQGWIYQEDYPGEVLDL